MAALTLAQKIRLLWLAFVDKRTSFAPKALAVFGLLYGILPIDFVPDIIPILGFLDDTGIILAVIIAYLQMTEKVRRDLRKETIIDTTATRKK